MDGAMFLRGLLIGLSIAALVGPMGVLCIRRTLAGGRLAGLITGLGVATVDGIYAGVTGFGLSVVAALLGGQEWIRGIGGLFLCYLGIRTARTSPADECFGAGFDTDQSGHDPLLHSDLRRAWRGWQGRRQRHAAGDRRAGRLCALVAVAEHRSGRAPRADHPADGAMDQPALRCRPRAIRAPGYRKPALSRELDRHVDASHARSKHGSRVPGASMNGTGAGMSLPSTRSRRRPS